MLQFVQGDLQLRLLQIAASIVTLVGGAWAFVQLIPVVVSEIQDVRSFASRVYMNHRHKKLLKWFWTDYLNDEFIVVIPQKDIDELVEGTQYLDFLGKDVLLENLRSNFGPLEHKIRPVQKVVQDDYEHDIISIAGPIPNDVTAEILDSPEIVYKFREAGDSYSHNIVGESPDGEVDLFPMLQGQDNVQVDFGIITKTRDARNETTLISVAGGFGWGTYAGCELLTDLETLQYIKEKEIEYFQAVYAVRVDEVGNIRTPHLLDQHPNDELRRETLVDLSDSYD